MGRSRTGQPRPQTDFAWSKKLRSKLRPLPVRDARTIASHNVWSAAGLQGKSFGREDKSAAMYSAFEWRSSLLAMMSSAACLSLQVGRSLKTIIGIRLKARRCDCSFVVAVPVQTSVEAFSSEGLGLRSTVSRRRCPRPWARSALPSGILADAVLPLRCSD